MALSLLFWIALLLPGYVLVRYVSPDDLKAGVVGVVGLASMAAWALLSPVSILGYLLNWPVAVLSAACVIAVLGAVVQITRRRWWRDVGRLLVTAISFELLILVADMVMGARVGAFLYGADERLHIARIRFLLDHGLSNCDPYTATEYFFPIYHTNLLHALYAACARLTGVDVLGVWYVSLAPAKLLTAAGYYFLAWCLFERRWVAWIVALFVLGWLAPITYTVYPNQLASHWLLPMMIGFAVRACRVPCPVSASVKLAAGSLILGQVHSLYAVFAGIAIGPVLACVFLARLLRRHADRRRLGVCLAALFVAAPFAVIAKVRSSTGSTGQQTSIQQTARFHHWDNGWAMLKPTLFEGKQGIAHGALAVVGLACCLTGSRRRKTGVVVGVTATVAAVLFAPPLCGAVIKAFGAEWVAGRMEVVLMISLIALTLGGISSLVERPLRWTAVRSLVSIGVVFLGAWFAVHNDTYNWQDYYDTAKAPAAERYKTIESLRTLRELCRQHIPPGETVLADGQMSMWLVMLHDCHVVAVGRGGGVKDLPQREADLRVLLSRTTPWEVRRKLLRKYGINRLLMNTEFFPVAALKWVKGHLKQKPHVVGDFLVMALDTR